MSAGRSRRTGLILILLIVIVLGVGAAILLFVTGLGPLTTTTGTQEPGEAADTTPVPPPPTTVKVVVAARDIPRGARLTTQDVTIMNWPIVAEAPTPAGAIILDDGEEGPGLEQVEGRIARVDILTGQPVLDHLLTPSDEPTDLGDVGSDAALLIPQNQVAMTIPITRLSSVGYALRPGDHVDILMSFRFVDVDEDFQTLLPNSIIFTLFPADIEADAGIAFAGREEEGPFGTTLVVVPSELDSGLQRPRQTTQLAIDNAIVLRMGEWPLVDSEAPLVITPVPPTPVPEEGEVQEEGEAAATPIPIVPIPDIVTLVLTRQDALVLKYSIEAGAEIDLVLRSARDHDQTDIVTDAVTLQYIIDFYNITEPPRLGIAHDPRIDGIPLNLTGTIPETTPEPGQ